MTREQLATTFSLVATILWLVVWWFCFRRG